MKIGVFGDSFANKYAHEIWWRYLSDFGHDVTSFGEPGSSINFSAGEFWTHGRDFDFVIWCVTSSNRVSFYHDRQAQHVTNAFESEAKDPVLHHLTSIAKQYLTEVYEPHGHEVVNHLAVKGALNQYNNLLIIPCFDMPVYFMSSCPFNLYKLSTIEAQFYFPGKELYDIYQHYQDLRPGHFTIATHKILAQKIWQAIDNRKKIFSAEYSEFVVPSEPLSKVFIPR
jgi:hypothetical protein